MIKNNKIHIVVAIAVIFALAVSVTLVAVANTEAQKGNLKTEPEYARKIFGTDIISIDILADEDDWQEMLDNAINEQFIMADVIVNGTKFMNIGIRPKGNSSLTQVASSNSDRYSFRLQFNEYVKKQTCFGLESFVINNMLGDYTYMKEYISYDLMREAGVDAPYFGYAEVKVNGEPWGLYLAVELYNDSYEQRVFGDTKGMLYNVKMSGFGGNIGDFGRGEQENMPNRQEGWPQMPFGGAFQQNPGFQQGPRNEGGAPSTPPRGFSPSDSPPETREPSDSNTPRFPQQNAWPFMNPPQNNPPGTSDNNPPAMDDFNPPAWNNNGGFNWNFGGMGMRGGSGGSLEYIDDNPQSYPAIFNNTVGKGTEKDYLRVIEAIKALSEGKDLEKYFDIDKILRYLAAHTFVVNLDSYSSQMAQNYYIYERDGKVTVLPWDYNLAWGGFFNSSASSVINFPVDTPVSGVSMASRPLIDKLLSDEEYKDRYHGYLQRLVDNYFSEGKFEQKIKEQDALISEYVKNDPTAFCSYEEYKTAVSAFITLGNLRAQSVQGQLDGSVPSTTQEQAQNPNKLVPAGNLNLSVLGSMLGGRDGRNFEFPGGFQQEGGFGWFFQDGQQRAVPDRQMPAQGGPGQRGFFPGGQENREGRTQNRTNINIPRSRDNQSNSPILTGVLVLLPVAATVFVARYKRSY
jgi:spore coat protein CotH